MLRKMKIGWALAGVVVMFVVLPAHAATLNWNPSGADTKYLDAGNWSPAQVPVNGDDLIFGTGTRTDIWGWGGTYAPGSMTFDSGGASFLVLANNDNNIDLNGVTTSATGAPLVPIMTLTGATRVGTNAVWDVGTGTKLKLVKVVVGANDITKNGDGELNFYADTTYTGAMTMNAGSITGTSSDSFQSSLVLNGGTMYWNWGNATQTRTAALSGTAGTVDLKGYSTWELDCDTSGFTGTVDLAYGNLLVTSTSAGFNHGALVRIGLTSGTLSNRATFQADGLNVLADIAVRSGGTGVDQLIATRNATLSGGITIGTGGNAIDKTIQFRPSSGKILTVDGDIGETAGYTGNASLDIAAGGKVILNGSVSSSGTVNVGWGTLVVNGPMLLGGDVTVSSISSLMGTGMILRNVEVNGSIAAGNGSGTSTLTIDGNVNLNGEMKSGLIDVGCDLLDIGGNLDLDVASILGILMPQGEGNLSGTYTIVNYGSTLTGTFGTVNNMPSGYSIDYGSGSNSSITLVPEPTVLSLLGLGGISLIGRRRRSRQSKLR